MRATEVRGGRYLLALACGACLLHGQAGAQPGPASRPASDVSVVCVAERPVAHPGDTVFVRAWVTDDSGQPVASSPRFTWRVGRGSISGGERAVWSLDDVAIPTIGGVPRGVPVTATVRVEVDGRDGRHCELQILVVAPQGSSQPPGEPRRSERLTARILLPRGVSEPLEYGLRSYLLFGAPPRDDAQRERYLRAVEAYVRVLVPLEDFLEQNVRASQLNVTMIPTVRRLPILGNLSDPARARPAAAEILDAYDYARARLLLSDLGIDGLGGGPYLASRRPGAPGASASGLVIDMTGVSPSLIWDWMTWFSWLTGQERSWSETTLKRLGLSLRNIIAVAGSVTPVVFESVGEWMYVLRPR